MKWYWFVLLSLAMGGAVMYQLGGREGRVPKHRAAPSQAAPPRSQMQGIKLVEQAGPSTAWEILAEQAEFNDQANLAVARGVRAQLFQDDVALLSLEANRSIVRRDTGNITMQGQVRIQHQGGYTMMTKTLDWLAETRQLHTDEAVEVEGPSVYVTGKGLQSDVDQQRFHLEQNVHASFRLR